MIAFSSCLKQPAKKSSPGRQDMVASGSESSIGGLLFPSALSRKASSTLSTVLALVSKDRLTNARMALANLDQRERF